MPVTIFRAALLAGLVAIPPLALLGLPATTIVFTLCALAALPVLAPQWRAHPWRANLAIGAAGLVVLAIPLLGLVSASWSIMPGESAARAAKLLAIAAGGLALAAGARGPAAPGLRPAIGAVLVGMAIAVGLALTDHLFLFEVMEDVEPGFTPRRGFYSRGATVLVLFAWLAVIGLVRLEKRWIAAALYLGVGLLVALKFRSGAAATVWALGAGAFVLQLATLGRARLAIAGAVAAACLAAPLLVQSFPAPDAQHAAARLLPSSWSHRIVIWQFAAAKIAERPLLGWGLDASRKIPGGRETIPWQMDPDPNDAGDRMSVVQRLPLHPHSVSLQLWLELGAIGAALLAALAFLLVAGAKADRGAAWPDAGRLALACSGLAIANVSYGAWQTWWLSTLFMVAAAALLLLCRRDATP